MVGVLKYSGVFVVAAVLLQLFVFDSMRLSIYFNPLPYIAFVLLLPMKAKPLAVLLLGFATGVFVDMFEGTAGLHTVVTLIAAYTRRYMMIVTLGRENVEEEGAMPSPKSVGVEKFARYISLAAFTHSLLFFCFEGLTWHNMPQVLLKTVVSGSVTLLAVWMTALLFTVKTRKRT